MTERCPFTVETDYEALLQGIDDWFDVALYHSAVDHNQALTEALQELKHFCRLVVLKQNEAAFADFYQRLVIFNENFGADQQETNYLCELLSYFQPVKDATTKA